MQTLAILVAAGRGERMGAGRPKAFIDLGGQPLLLRAARALAACSTLDELVAVVPEEAQEEAHSVLSGVAQRIVVGGARRQDSVLAGLRAAPDGFAGIVLVHDAARPFVTPEIVEAVAEAARRVGAAVPVLPLHDTIKTVEDGWITATLDRSRLVSAQTPQGFRFDLLMQACEAAARDGVALTDEAMAIERLGAPVAAVPGSPRNRKLTTPADLEWARRVLAEEAQW